MLEAKPVHLGLSKQAQDRIWIRQKVCTEGLTHLARKQGQPVQCYANSDDGALH